MSKFLLIGIAIAVAWLIARIARRGLTTKSKGGEKSARAKGAKMIPCPRCGTYIAEDESCDCGKQ